MLKQCRYKFVDGKVISTIFPSDAPLDGWSITPEILGKPKTKGELEAYAKDKFGVDLDKRKSLKTLKAQVEALENDDSTDSN